jgi:hypothetical protein
VDRPIAPAANSRYYVYKALSDTLSPTNGCTATSARRKDPVTAPTFTTTTSRPTSRARRRSPTARPPSTPRQLPAARVVLPAAPHVRRHDQRPAALLGDAHRHRVEHELQHPGDVATTASTCASPPARPRPSGTSCPPGSCCCSRPRRSGAAARWATCSRPAAINLTPQSYVGASNVPPVVVNNLVLYAAARGGHMRELSYAWQASSFVSGDISLMAPHLFDYQHPRHVLQRGPDPHAVGGLLQRQAAGHDLRARAAGRRLAPARHGASGVFESCAVVTENNEDMLYVVVRRTINGAHQALRGAAAHPQLSPRWPMRSTSTRA